MRSVFTGSVTAYRIRRPSSGLDFLTSGSEPSAFRSTPIGRSFSSTRVAMLAALTGLPYVEVTCAAISSYVRCPSIASRTWNSNGVSWIICPSARRTSDGGSL